MRFDVLFGARLSTAALFPLILLTISVAAQPTLEWGQQLGSGANDLSYDVAVDSMGHAYIAGLTYGSLAAPYVGTGDAFLAKYDAGGNLIWATQQATSRAFSVTVDQMDRIYIAGRRGNGNAMLNKYDADGNLLWDRQLGVASDEGALGVAVDNIGNAYITG